jgi:hypothetical protein
VHGHGGDTRSEWEVLDRVDRPCAYAGAIGGSDGVAVGGSALNGRRENLVRLLGDPARVGGSRTVVLPGAGQVPTAENIRPVWRHVRTL